MRLIGGTGIGSTIRKQRSAIVAGQRVAAGSSKLTSA
jgi:hypothetical protein